MVIRKNVSMRLTVNILAGVLCIAAFGCTPADENESVSDVEPTEPATSPEAAVVDVGAAAFAIPNGWHGDGDSSGAALLPNDNVGSDAELMISVFVNDPASSDAKGHARLIAERTAGKDSPLTDGVAGEIAFRVSSPRIDEKAEEWIIVNHSGKTYTISGESTEEFDCWPVLDEIRQSWTWK